MSLYGIDRNQLTVCESGWMVSPVTRIRRRCVFLPDERRRSRCRPDARLPCRYRRAEPACAAAYCLRRVFPAPMRAYGWYRCFLFQAEGSWWMPTETTSGDTSMKSTARPGIHGITRRQATRSLVDEWLIFFGQRFVGLARRTVLHQP